MPRAAVRAKPKLPAPPAAKARPRPKKRRKLAPPKLKPSLLTPTESQKVWLAGVLLATFLLAFALHSGEVLPSNDGWSIHFHDLRGRVVLNLELSTHHLPRVAFH